MPCTDLDFFERVPALQYNCQGYQQQVPGEFGQSILALAHLLLQPDGSTVYCSIVE